MVTGRDVTARQPLRHLLTPGFYVSGTCLDSLTLSAVQPVYRSAISFNCFKLQLVIALSKYKCTYHIRLDSMMRFIQTYLLTWIHCYSRSVMMQPGRGCYPLGGWYTWAA